MKVSRWLGQIRVASGLIAAALLGPLACSGGHGNGASDAATGPDTYEVLELQRSRGPQDDECAKLTEQACQQTAACWLLKGSRLDRARRCWLPREAAGCRYVDLRCGDAVSTARDSERGCWQFSSTCIPIGWNLFYGNADPVCGYDTPQCTPP